MGEAGLEPARPKPPHFECGASTNSATRPNWLHNYIPFTEIFTAQSMETVKGKHVSGATPISRVFLVKHLGLFRSAAKILCGVPEAQWGKPNRIGATVPKQPQIKRVNVVAVSQPAL